MAPPIKLTIPTKSNPPIKAESPQAATPKLTLKLSTTGTSSPSTPVAVNGSASKKSKRISTPTSKILAKAAVQSLAPRTSSAKKRKAADAIKDGTSQPKLKRVKILAKSSKAAGTPLIKTKMKGKPPPRPLGVGYDSEGDDIEADPLVEKGFILRMQPGPDCEYLREAIANRTIGLPRNKGGADVWLKFFSANGKRGIVCVRQNLYAATLVDLPCIIETMKSWDKKSWFKTVDVCQMLLIIGQVKTEAEAKTIPLPSDINATTNGYAHGLTAPMHNVRRRRFRKRISNRTIEAVEEEVERLLELDRDSDEKYKWYVEDIDRMNRQSEALSDESGDEDGDEEDGEGEEEYDEDEGSEVEIEVNPEDYFGNVDDEEHDPDDMEALLQREMLGETATVAVDTPGGGVATVQITGAGSVGAVSGSAASASGAPTPSGADEDDSGDDESDEDEDEDGEVDDEQRARNQEREAQLEEIATVKALIKAAEANWRAAPDNKLIRDSIEDRIRGLKRQLEIEESKLGDDDE